MGIYEDIQNGQDKVNDAFKKALPPTLNEMVEDIKKAKAAQIGEIRTWSGVKMRKEANGWVPVKEGSGGKGKEEEGKIKEAGPEDLLEHARNASETALMNATKVSGDPAVREAAHKELMRRKSEEAQETFKAPGEGIARKTGKGGGDPGREKDGNEYDEEGKTTGGKESKPKAEKSKEEPKKEEKKPDTKKEEKEGELPFEKKMKEFRKEMADLGEKITNYKTEKEFDDYMLQIKAVTAEMKAFVTKEMKAQGDKLVKDQEGKKEEGKVSNDFGIDYKNVQSWVGDEYTDKQINGVMDSLYEEGSVSKKDLAIKGAKSQMHESELVHEKVKDLFGEVRIGLWPADLNPDQIEDILWGVVMSAK